ncbi:hypothetical protein ACVWXN_004861 [Bradyrhizobium sp. i1.4.4]
MSSIRRSRRNATRLFEGSSDRARSPSEDAANGRHQSGIAGLAETDEVNLAGEFREKGVARGNSDRRLADAARADDRDETLGFEPFRYILDGLLAAHHLPGMCRQVVRANRLGRCRLILLRCRGRTDETITLSRDRAQIFGAGIAVPERLAECCDMDAQAVVIDAGAWPCPGYQIALADDFARMPDQCQQQVKCASRQLDRIAILLDPSLRSVQTKRPKDENLLSGALLERGSGRGCCGVALPAVDHLEISNPTTNSSYSMT